MLAANHSRYCLTDVSVASARMDITPITSILSLMFTYSVVFRLCRHPAICLHPSHPVISCPAYHHGVWVGYPVAWTDGSWRPVWTPCLAKFIVGNVYQAPSCGAADNRPAFTKMHFLYYGEDLLTQPCSQGLSSSCLKERGETLERACYQLRFVSL